MQDSTKAEPVHTSGEKVAELSVHRYIYCKYVLPTWLWTVAMGKGIFKVRSALCKGFATATECTYGKSVSKASFFWPRPSWPGIKKYRAGLLCFYWQLLKIVADNSPQTAAYQLHFWKPKQGLHYTIWRGWGTVRNTGAYVGIKVAKCYFRQWG